MKKVLALFLSLVLILIPLSSVVVFADPAEGYELNGTTFTVYTVEGYNAVAALINDGQLDYNVTLAKDLAFTPDGENANFITIGKAGLYTGTFDGAGHTISGMQTATDTLNAKNAADANNRYRALIGQAGGGCAVRNLTIINSRFIGSEYVSAVIGAASGAGLTVSNVHVRNTVIQGDMTAGKTVGNNVGGLCGRFVTNKSGGDASGDALFQNCTIDATIRSFKNAVGICGGEATGKALNVAIVNCAVAGEIETTITTAKNGGTAGFFGWTNGVNLRIENCVCVATLKSACNECGFVNNLARNSTIEVTNCIGIGPAFGAYNTAAMAVSFADTVVLNLSADCKSTAEVDLWNTKPASVTGTLEIDGEEADFLTATLPMTTLGGMRKALPSLYGSTSAISTKAAEVVDAAVLKLSGITVEGIQLSEINTKTKTLSIRLVGTIDAYYTQIDELGFDVAYTDSDYNDYSAQEVGVTAVYESILANDDGNMVTHAASDFGANYIFALTLKDVPAVGTCVFTVTPFVKSRMSKKELKKWAGTTYEITFVDGEFSSSTPVVGGI